MTANFDFAHYLKSNGKAYFRAVSQSLPLFDSYLLTPAEGEE